MLAPPRGGRAPTAAAAGVAVLLALGGVAGLATAVVGRDDNERSASPPQPRAPSVVVRGALRVELPSQWSPVRAPTRVPGMPFPDPIAIGNPSSDVRVVAGTLRATSRTLLPAAFVAGLDEPPPAPERVRIGKLDALLYAGLTHPAVRESLDVYVAPTTSGIVTVACLAKAVASLLADCWTVVSKISLAKGGPLPIDRASAFRDALDDRIDALDALEASARRGLSRAMTPTQQAYAIAGLAAAFRDAARSIAPLAPGSLEGARDVVHALRRTGGAYAGLHRSLASASDDYARWTSQVRRSRVRLRRLLERTFPQA